jgi:hypothetical protein
MTQAVLDWNSISGNYTDTLILGNGASIACDTSFSYSSLLDVARANKTVDSKLEGVFDLLETEDFELVLRTIWQAHRINVRLGNVRSGVGSQGVLGQAYEAIKQALIQSINDVHPDRTGIEQHLSYIADFMTHFRTVLSLNYDLIIFWAIMERNSKLPGSLKDCFINGQFEPDYEFMRHNRSTGKSSTLVFYPHGFLTLVSDLTGEKKMKSAGQNLLDRLARYMRIATPIFVSEGTSEQKLRAIRRSDYLSAVYDKELRSDHESIAVYGWAVGEQDNHLVNAIASGSLKRVAVSVFMPAFKTGKQLKTYQDDITDQFDSMKSKPQIEFFDATSSGAWLNP